MIPEPDKVKIEEDFKLANIDVNIAGFKIFKNQLANDL